MIPVYNDPEGISRTIKSILNNTQYSDLDEIIVVDNNSSDNTGEIIKKFARNTDLVNHASEAEVQTSYAARNTGIERATGDYIVFLDANVTVSESWLIHAVDEMSSAGAQYMGCAVKVVDDSNEQTVFSKYNQHTTFMIEELIKKHGYAPTVCLFVTKELIDDIGQFDEHLISTGDMEFGNRVKECGYKLHYTDRVTICHPARTSFSSLVNRNMRIGRGHCQLQRRHPSRYGKPGLPPRPSGISGDQFDTQTRPIWTLIDLFLTTIKGFGYYSEFLFPTNTMINN
ncbi:glycosyltransferase AglI [Halorubrum distributum JCM 13561]|uniref:Glycosyltransferase AglI n=1 Tax=Halorubrum distributum JCM 13561 TaxID=1227483 RepID=M0P3G4_9EURY|nr:glycosyltransferase AglI [Halorubrum litoreum JCM 13561]